MKMLERMKKMLEDEEGAGMLGCMGCGTGLGGIGLAGGGIVAIGLAIGRSVQGITGIFIK